jgi:protein-S-isoprenylcysteine O-methyltransferase Ste14
MSELAPGRGGLVLKALPRLTIYFILLAASLFVPAGRIDWPMAWVYFGIMLIITFAGMWTMDPGLIGERMHGVRGGPGAKKWDRVFVALIGTVGTFATPVVAGLDLRFTGSRPVGPGAEITAAVLVAAGFGLVYWAMTVNRFFSAVVRIQTERGHAVVTSGPYRVVRHPGYVGAVVYELALPVMLGSLWALIPAAAAAAVFVVRTVLEDRTLRAELPGYEEYAARVRWRLLPGVW